MQKIIFFYVCVIIPNLVILTSSGYNYDSYSATSTNTNLSGQSISNSANDASAVYITSSGITITDSKITKSGTSSNTENSEFYGVNAAVLVQGGGLTMTGGSITTSGQGANALVATNDGTVTISGATITSTGKSSARGLHATYGGKITASDMTISSTGGSCATLATDRGEGTVTCSNCKLSTSGAGSPLIYSTGSITVTGSTGTSSGAQAVVIEGKNTAIINTSTLQCTATPNNKDDSCGVLIYQSMSGDADSGTSTFTCKQSTIEILSNNNNYYSSAPMFYVTNTAANINIEDCTLTFGSGTFLKVAEGDWGTSGSNGGTVTLTLTNQDIEGNIVVDSSSSLTINLVDSSIKGTINSAKTAAKLAIVMDSDSSLTLTGNSYYTSLKNDDSDNSNINNGGYTFESYTEQNTIPNTNSNNSPNGSDGTPPSRSGSTNNIKIKDTDISSFDIYDTNNAKICCNLKSILFSLVLLLSLIL